MNALHRLGQTSLSDYLPCIAFSEIKCELYILAGDRGVQAKCGASNLSLNIDIEPYIRYP